MATSTREHTPRMTAAHVPEIAAPARDDEPRMYRIPDATRLLGMGRSMLYEQIQQGRLRCVHQGRACLIPSTAIADYIELLEREEAERRGSSTSAAGTVAA